MILCVQECYLYEIQEWEENKRGVWCLYKLELKANFIGDSIQCK